MADFNGQSYNGAKNINNVSTEVALVFVRAAGSDGEYVEVPSTSNVLTTADPTTIVDIRSESRGTATKQSNKGGNITFDLTENGGLSLFAKFLGMSVVSNAAGSTTITDRRMKFEGDTIEFPEISNDGNGVTSLVVKPTVGGTALTLNTDYTVELVGNITRIKVKAGGAIVNDQVIFVTGAVLVNANETTQYVATYAALPALDFRIVTEKTIAGVAKYKRVEGKSMTINSTYVLPFLNAVEAGGAQNTSLQFDLDGESSFDIVNEQL